MPRLVRLNPNCPFKTRGNGAVALDLVRPRGARVQIGSWGGRPVYAYPDGTDDLDAATVVAQAWDALRAVAQPDAHPVVAAGDVPAAAYWQAVQTAVDPSAVRPLLDQVHGDGQALVGCAAALAWPGPASSYELIAYRRPTAWGTRRSVDGAHLRALDAHVTFHTWDEEARHLACVPGTPCPVLAGLRGMDPDGLRAVALPALRHAAEPFDDWMLWATNHASGDHVVAVETLAAAPTWATVRVPLTVTGPPAARAGGHVFVPLRDRDGEDVEAIAFEPTKSFRHSVLSLRPDDRVEVVGALADGGLRLESLRATGHRRDPPLCCGQTMKSRGRGEGLRCRECGSRRTEQQIAVPFTVQAEVPISARRHLHRPFAFEPAAP